MRGTEARNRERERGRERNGEREKERQRGADTDKFWGLLYESFGRKPG